jgi:hypothetical protein
MADSKPLRTSDVTQEVAIRMGKQGIAAAPAQTVMNFWDDAVKVRGDRPALHQQVVKKVWVAALNTPCRVCQSIVAVLTVRGGVVCRELSWPTHLGRHGRGRSIVAK